MGSDVEYPPEDLEAMSAGKAYTAWIHSFFEPHIAGDVAEVGAGIGVYSKLLLNSTAVNSLTVFEPSVNLETELRAAISNVDKPTEFRQQFFQADAKYDTIVYINVMEHIKDDVAEMKMAFDALNSGGKLLVFVPANPFLYSENDRKVGHYRRYTRRELLEKVRMSGFNVLNQRYFDSLGVLSWLVCCKWLKMSPAAGSVGLYDKLFVPFLRGMERLCAPPLGKNLIVVSQKK